MEITENCEGFGVRPKRKFLYFEFLKDAKEKLNNHSLNMLFDKTIECYQNVRENLVLLVELYPHSPDSSMGKISKDQRVSKAVDALKIAKEDEIKGLTYLSKLKGGISNG